MIGYIANDKIEKDVILNVTIDNIVLQVVQEFCYLLGNTIGENRCPAEVNIKLDLEKLV